ncbi:MAG: type I glyceraldehyde-3-phosphate dehydrogenase, partial [Deltaproteobacteria bacterium]|nr:type I glyceraldehyde-3-phosphate dehydrogenase [Deltaproteobacteria bacterium]
MMPAIAINGFGRIGRLVMRAGRGNPAFDVKAINDIADAKTMAHLFKYDSNYGPYQGEVRVEGDNLVIDGKTIRVTSERDPANLPWKELGVDVVLECTGIFTDVAGGEKHLAAGAKKVLFSAPAKGDGILTVVKGVNHGLYSKDTHNLVSNASCTTNCLAPVVKVLHEKFGIKRGLMTTIHAYTNDQATLDQPHKDLRRARAAGLSMIPTSTGAARAIGLVMPELKGRLDGFAVRVPTATVSVVDVTFELEKSTTAEEVNAALKAAAEGPMKGVLGYTDEPLVSMDFKGDPRSSIVDGLSTAVMDGNMVKVVSWYDNEWGFS